MTVLEWVLVAVTFLLAGLVKGVIGLGLPTVAVGLLGLVMAPAQAAALLVVPATVTNIWQLAAGPAFMPLIRRLWPLLAGVFLGAWGLFWLGLGLGGQGGHTGRVLGIALMAYALLGLTGWRPVIRPQTERWLAFPIGLASGAITAASGVFVLPAVPYIQAMGLGPDALVQGLGLYFTTTTFALAGGLFSNGVFTGPLLLGSCVAVVPALLGMMAGQWLRGRLSPRAFRRCFFIGLLVLAMQITWHG